MAPKRRRGSAKAPPRPKHVLSLASPAQRIAERAKIGNLRHALIQPATMAKYRTALAYFFHYLSAGGLELPSCQDDFDDVVCHCIHGAFLVAPRSHDNVLATIRVVLPFGLADTGRF